MKKLLICCWILVLSTNLTFSQEAAPETGKTGITGYSPSLFYHAIIYRNALGLSEYIVDSLNAGASIGKALEISDPDFNIRVYEQKIVRSLLSDDQYINLLVIKNKPVAKELTAKVWAEMVKQLLVTDTVDTKLYERVKAHLLTVLVTREYFSDNPDKQRKHLRELDERAPSSLYKYYHHGYSKPVETYPFRAEVIW